ncbi:sodium- and chloride-dependent GABA transporter 2 isoform X2 [Ictalurus furcatus]|uniref:sodium- and chloride-dependent GABA transporter 2 isoform X2 n=1 Tax=Ictalurus furcatus TaxID=66913 RepID=UPI002350BB89|nr:sodium- and chloride-dependent GABA transporter 2 isoform X2 [Ictalurus furcatus]
MPEARGQDTVIEPAEDPQIWSEKGKGATLEQREKWANKTEFMLSMAGEIIGLGNVWRFPYLCYKNGGGVFFIPYFVFLIFCGIPVFFLETALGQYTSEGGITAWRKICPMFEGIGIASQVIVIYLNIYYIVVLAWAVFYLFSCFQTTLPWISCVNEWNTESCHTYNKSLLHSGLHRADADWSFLYNETYKYSSVNLSAPYKVVSPEEEFWLHRVQRISSDDTLGTPHYDLTLCLLLVWIICYFCIWKGVKTTGKVVYFTATFPYVMLLILFFRGVTLPGAGTGISYYLYPDISKLSNPDVWCDAGTQVFFSYAVCQGVLTALGSYNKYNNNCYKDCIALCALNSGTSIFAGFAVFSIMGYMAHELSLPMEDIVKSGPGLAFIAYPKALSLLPGPHFWSVLFFLMVLFLGLDSQFVCVESLATALTDVFPGILRKPKRREILVLLIAVVCFLLGLPLVTRGGLHLFKLIDMYGPSGTNLLLIACFETLVIGWVYGADRFFDNIEDMIGYPPWSVLKYCWLFITPFICGATLLYDLISSPSLSASADFVPSWGSAVAVLLTLTPMICIPIFVLVAIKKGPGLIVPSADLHQRSPNKPRLTLCKHVIIKRQKLSHTAGEKSVEEKALKEDTTDM